MITLDLKPEVQAELARRAAAEGQDLEAYTATLLEQTIHDHITTKSESAKARAQAAAVRIRELRKGVTLGGLTIRELIDEGRQ